MFLFIVGGGIYLWMPRRWTWQRVKAISVFNVRLRGKARDFNWHNAIGIWSAIPLLVIVASAVPMSFPWGNALVYRLAGDQPPAASAETARAGARPAGNRTEGRADGSSAQPAPFSMAGLDAMFARAARQESGWRTITLRLPGSPRAPLAFAIDRGDGGQPHLRSTLTLARGSGNVVSYESFSSQSPGRRLRSVLRFAHTGEIAGLSGQTVAGLATAGAVVLACTGLLLATRRFVAWRSRRSTRDDERVRSAA